MQKYKVKWTQTLADIFEVEAETEEEAIAIVASGECGDVDVIESNDFEIVS